MASTFKLPVLVELHAMAKAGTLDWDERIEVTSKDQHLGSGDITPLFDPPGLSISMRNMANMMMMISDETNHRARPLRSTRNPSMRKGNELLMR